MNRKGSGPESMASNKRRPDRYDASGSGSHATGSSSMIQPAPVRAGRFTPTAVRCRQRSGQAGAPWATFAYQRDPQLINGRRSRPRY